MLQVAGDTAGFLCNAEEIMEREFERLLIQTSGIGLPDRDLERKWPPPRILAGERPMMANYCLQEIS